jgi:hypothetical protein
MDLTPEQKEAKRLWMDCYPNDLDNGYFMKGCWGKFYAKKIANEIIKETLAEYSNDENHERVLFWKTVIIEIDNIKLLNRVFAQ